jgi:hypothetical protein
MAICLQTAWSPAAALYAVLGTSDTGLDHLRAEAAQAQHAHR